jgi:RNA polymerase sigma-70 factor (ECF subfamily)
MTPPDRASINPPPAGGMSDEELVAHILSGDTNQFDILCERYNEAICRYVIHLTNIDVGYDLAQNIFEKVYKNLRSLKTGACFKPWLYRIAHREVQDYWRRCHAKVWVSLEQVKEDAIKYVVGMERSKQEVLGQRIEDSELIRQAMSYVSERYRSCTYLAIFEGMKAPEIAACLNVPERTTRRYIQAGIGELIAVREQLMDMKKESR